MLGKTDKTIGESVRQGHPAAAQFRKKGIISRDEKNEIVYNTDGFANFKNGWNGGSASNVPDAPGFCFLP
jgi:hypothetical protein